LALGFFFRRFEEFCGWFPRARDGKTTDRCGWRLFDGNSDIGASHADTFQAPAAVDFHFVLRHVKARSERPVERRLIGRILLQQRSLKEEGEAAKS